MQLPALPVLSLLVTAASLSLDLQYELPAELLALAGPVDRAPVAASATAPDSLSSSSSSSSSLSSPSSSSSASSTSCTYPRKFVLDDFTTWSPVSNTSLSYVSFVFSDNGTQITTPCSYNATSQSLTAGTGLAARYACDNQLISFIWQRNVLTAIETVCPGQTTTKFEASGSVLPTGLACTPTNCTSSATSSTRQIDGTLCRAAMSLSGNFTSLQPSPLQS